ncbi:ARM repeat-containing protein [Pleurotus eryngii]|uniref:Importin-13 n=1 Tax=Pleurotus eryngii TaxID=5323 RepID=A0A9P5ZX50_PLEER|nr:ARM repeat-containing protein [Pleurotus eryngii]
MAAPFLPVLSTPDIEQATQLIQTTYAPAGLSPETQKRLQQEIFDIQKRPAAWGLVIPFLEHPDPNVQFFGAHTAQVKIARDWEAFPHEHDEELRDLLVQLTSRAIATSSNKVILRKLYVALTSLALILVPKHPSRWPGWIQACVSSFSANGGASEHILDFLAIAAEEVETAVIWGPSKMQLNQSLLDAVPMVVQAITATVTNSSTTVRQRQSALKCLEAWLTLLPTSDITPLIPLLINLLAAANDDDDIFTAASDTLQEVMSKSALSDGAGTRTLTEPLLIWLISMAAPAFDSALANGAIDERAHSLCKLITAIGDHSTSYIAANLASAVTVSIPAVTFPWSTQRPFTRAQLTQNFLRMLLAFTALPGYHGVDEEESEMTLSFWYLFQETLWSIDYDEDAVGGSKEDEVVAVSRAVYSQLVQVLRRKMVWPAPMSGWTRDQIDKFQVYRRDVGDTLINAYYVLRDDMLDFYLNDVSSRLVAMTNGGGWEDIEATLHCIVSIQESMDLEKTPQLAGLFTPEILGRLPSSGRDRVRRTMLSLIGTYASWFAAQPLNQSSGMLMTVVGYVVAALPEPTLSLAAANALRELCDVNRTALAPHIAAFGELHAGLVSVADSERGKVLQSISSVIQALPPEDEIPSLEAIVRPVVEKLSQTMQNARELPEDSKSLAVIQIETLRGVAKGLTRTHDGMAAFEDSPDVQAEVDKMKRAREEPRMVQLRKDVLDVLSGVIDVWSTDMEVSSTLSELFKAMTALPVDTTLLSLPAGPILELVCLAAQRRLTSIWLSLAGILIAQMNPPSLLLTLKAEPTPEDTSRVSAALPILLQASLSFLSQPQALEDNPDVVTDFFGCVDTVAKNFPMAFFVLPAGALDSLMQCSLTSMALQERYSLVSVCNFLGTLLNQLFIRKELEEARLGFVQTHAKALFRAVLGGFAGVAPRSVTPNLTELLSILLSRCTEECRVWVREILYSNDFVESKAGPEAKDRFIKAIQSSRSMKKTRDAANEFTLVARGLEGANFGYATITR